MARPASDLDRRIVRAARKRFLQKGVDGASLRSIARDARTNIGMIYYYFPTKDDLFLAVMEETYARILGDLEQALDPARSVEARLAGLFERFANLAPDELDIMRILMREAMTSTARRDRIMARFMRGHVPLILRTMAEGVQRKELRGNRHPGALMISTFLMAIVPQIIRRLVGDHGEMGAFMPQPEALAKELFAILLHGISV